MMKEKKIIKWVDKCPEIDANYEKFKKGPLPGSTKIKIE